MIIQATRTMLAVALTAGCFGHGALASAMKETSNPSLPSQNSLSDPLPVLPPSLPSESNTLLDTLLTPNSIASQTLTTEAPPAFSQETLLASLSRASTVKPEDPAPLTPRPSSEPSTEKAEFTLPEPSSIILVLTGLIGLTARRHMRKNNANHV